MTVQQDEDGADRGDGERDFTRTRGRPQHEAFEREPEDESQHRRAHERDPGIHVKEVHHRQRKQAADDGELALREIDDARRAQDDVNSKRDERVAATDRQARDKELEHGVA